jgi:hypothetical protein
LKQGVQGSSGQRFGTDEVRPDVTVEVALFAIHERALCLALTKRKGRSSSPELGLIGGPIRQVDADTAATARRLLSERAGLKHAFAEQLMTFSGAKRETRRWSLSIAYYALSPYAQVSEAHAAGTIALFPIDRLPRLPSDQSRIAGAALKRVRGKSAYTSLPSQLLPPEFTFPDLKSAYELAMGEPLNDSAFRRKIGDLGIIEEVPEAKAVATSERRRPAQLYRLKHCDLVEFDRTV